MTIAPSEPAGRARGDILRRAVRHIERRLFDNRPAATSTPLPYPSVDLFWWKPASGLNFGDVLSEVVVAKLLAGRGLSLRNQTERQVRLLAIGSILHFAGDGDVVWGSGINGKVAADRHVFRTLDVRAVRGPMTGDMLRKRGVSVPETYGDPALLLPSLFPGLAPNPTRPFVVVPNLHDMGILDRERMDYLSPMRGWNICVESILGARLVIASSLHAIVIAEAFGIPARYVRLSDSEDLFKYEDYVLGTGRSRLDPAPSIAEAKEMGGMPPIRFDSQPLLEAFPFDLWERKST